MNAAAAAQLQPLLGNIRNFLTQSGYPVRDYSAQPIFGTEAATGTPAGAVGLSLPGEVDFNPSVVEQLRGLQARYGRRGPLTQRQVDALSVATHEGLHQMRYGRTPDVYVTNQGRDFEEGATEAATQDLLPILTARLFGQRLPGARMRMLTQEPSYPGLVKNIRQLSVFGSGAKTFTDHDARAWRRSFLHADADHRQQMADQAMQQRVAWGARTGR